MKVRTLFAATLAAVLWLAVAPDAEAWWHARYGYHYGGYGGYGRYNAWTGGSYHYGYGGYNAYTGRYGASRTFYNPYTGRAGHVGAVYNPYTGRYAYRYGYGY
jgi:hypothetical protein